MSTLNSQNEFVNFIQMIVLTSNFESMKENWHPVRIV